MKSLLGIFSRTNIKEELDVAVGLGDAGRVDKLLRRGVDPNDRGGPLARQCFLGRAVERDSTIDVIDLLLEAGADPRLPYRMLGGYEVSFSEAAEYLGRSREIIDRLRHAEQEAIQKWGPGPEFRKLSDIGCGLKLRR